MAGLREDLSTIPEGEVSLNKILEETPAYVISGFDERWQHVRHVLSALHISAERVWPPKPSLHLATKMYAIHDYDMDLDVADPVHQRYFSLLVAWKQALHHLAHHPGLEPHDWGIIVEDDISLHGDVSLAAAQAAILHGFDLARSEGWLYLGMCTATCSTETEQVYQGLTFAKSTGFCSHALAFTKHRAATIFSDMHRSMREDYMPVHGSREFGESIDQLLEQYSHGSNGTWIVGSNLSKEDNTDGQWPVVYTGLFYQDRSRFKSTISAMHT